MKILVTGAAGAVGSHVAERLAELGHEVIGLDCLTDYYDRSIKELNVEDLRQRGVETLLHDLVDDPLDSAGAVDVIYHFAAQPGISAETPFEDYLRNNIVATHRLLEVARRNKKLKGFIHISTSSVYGAYANGVEMTEPRPTSYYGVTKLAGEQLAMAYHREHGLPVVVLRLFSVYGPRERPEKLYHKLIKNILADQSFPLHEGSNRHIRSYSYIGDIVDGCILALDKLEEVTGEIFNIGTDQLSTTGEGIKIVETLLNKPAKIIIVPRRSGDQLETGANINKARQRLGYNPRTKLAEGLKAQVDWYKDLCRRLES
jgi:nucleoside-diphosphate-sugar epimerase